MSLPARTTVNLDDWEPELPLISDWVGPMWDAYPAPRLPMLSHESEDPTSLAVASWLTVLFGFSM